MKTCKITLYPQNHLLSPEVIVHYGVESVGTDSSDRWIAVHKTQGNYHKYAMNTVASYSLEDEPQKCCSPHTGLGSGDTDLIKSFTEIPSSSERCSG